MTTKTTSIAAEWGNLITMGQHALTRSKDDIWRTEPVDAYTFTTSPEYLNQNMFGISEAQKEFLEIGSDFENLKDFLILFVGKGGGKNWASGVLFLYVVYRLLCMYDPHAYLNHNKDKAITLMNVAINAKQAKKNFFNPVSSMLKNAGDLAFKPFGFNAKTAILTDSIQFPQNIELISANSQAGGIEGYDILMALADEIDDVQFYDVDRIIDTLRTSATTRFHTKAKIIVISYRRYIGSSGKIVEYYNRYRNLPNVYAKRYSSWEFHPVLTKADFDKYYRENPEKAGYMIGSELGGSLVDAWIKDYMRIKKAMNLNRTWILDWPLPYEPETPGSAKWWSRGDHGDYRQVPMSESEYEDNNGVIHRLDPYDIPIKEPGNPNYKYVFVGDPALGSEENGGDGYGVSMGHRVLVPDGHGGTYPRVVVDFAFRFTGRMFEEKQVQMVAIQKLIAKLKNRYGYNIRIVSMDGWNAASTVQWVAKTYRDIVVYGNNLVETEDYTTLRDVIFGEAPPSNGTGEREKNGGIDFTWHPIVFEELRRLVEDRSKARAKIDHPADGSKDMADTLAKLSHILVRRWPFTDIASVGMDASRGKSTLLEQKVATGVASEEERIAYNAELMSSIIGFSSIPKVDKNKPQINIEDLLGHVR